MAHKQTPDLHLVPLDTEGIWNRPLLENAAALSGAECVYAVSAAAVSGTQGIPSSESPAPLKDVLKRFSRVLACECARDSVSIYDFPAPREKTALLVGNEEKGIPRSVLKKTDSIISIPMVGEGMSSVNVAVAAAITLYALSKDLGRGKRSKSHLTHRKVDVLIHAPDDPHELGSLLRSAWSFGWKRIYLSDPNGVWFTQDPKTMLDSRAAARRYKNPLAVLPADRLDASSYEGFLCCSGQRQGSSLSRLRLPVCGKLLIEYGGGSESRIPEDRADHVFVDYTNTTTQPRFRHSGSILLSVISEMLGG